MVKFTGTIFWTCHIQAIRYEIKNILQTNHFIMFWHYTV